MESPIGLVKRLIDEGEKFNFQNFCYPRTDYPGKYGGDDTPEWLAWKTRCRNLIGQVLEENSPSNLLIKQGFPNNQMSEARKEMPGDLLKAILRPFYLTLRVLPVKAAEGRRTPGRFAPTKATQIRVSVLDCASPLALFPPLPVRTHLKFIRY